MANDDSHSNESSTPTSKKKKTSTFGAVTGGGVVYETAAHLPRQASQSISRLNSLATGLLASDNHGPEVAKEGSPEQRFEAAMRAYSRTDSDLIRMTRNTKKTFDLYLTVLVGAVLFGVLSLYFAPPANFLSSYVRFIPVPLVAALLFRSGYTNWLFRKRRLDGPLAYLKSGEIMPESPDPR
jgi:hypothetical protein